MVKANTMGLTVDQDISQAVRARVRHSVSVARGDARRRENGDEDDLDSAGAAIHVATPADVEELGILAEEDDDDEWDDVHVWVRRRRRFDARRRASPSRKGHASRRPSRTYRDARRPHPNARRGRSVSPSPAGTVVTTMV